MSVTRLRARRPHTTGRRQVARITYFDLLECIEGLPPDSASVTWVKSLNPESPVSEENAILIPAQARIDRRKLFEQEAGLRD